MCYIVSIGARAPAYRLARFFDEEAELDFCMAPLCTSIAGAFPAEDEVGVVTSRGCSCDLVAPKKRTPKRAAAFQRAVAQIARELGSVRLVVHRHRERCELPARAARVGLTVHELVAHENWFIEDAVMEISREAAPRYSGNS